jgi:hypothetical protein
MSGFEKAVLLEAYLVRIFKYWLALMDHSTSSSSNVIKD